jgi:hypothetical protein
MSFDIVLMAVVVAGIVLSAAYVRAEYIRWRENGATERRRESALRALHAARLSEQHSAASLPAVLKLQGFGNDGAVDCGGAANTGHFGSARNDFPRCDHFTERRKRERKSATQ